MVGPEYRIAISATKPAQNSPTVFTIVALPTAFLSKGQTHELSHDFPTLQAAMFGWTFGFVVNELGNRSEIHRIVEHLIATAQADAIPESDLAVPDVPGMLDILPAKKRAEAERFLARWDTIFSGVDTCEVQRERASALGVFLEGHAD